MGFSIAGNYLTQYSATRIGIAPGICLGWASGAPNSFADDTRLCRTSASLLTLDNGAAGAATFKAATLQATTSSTTPSLAIKQRYGHDSRATHDLGGIPAWEHRPLPRLADSPLIRESPLPALKQWQR